MLNDDTELRQFTFSDDPTGGDGVLIDKETGTTYLTEHVYIPSPEYRKTTESVEDLMIDAVRHKARKGKAYAEGKFLVIFSDTIGRWFPNRVGRSIEGIHDFVSAFAVGLESGYDSGYVYWATRFFTAPYKCPTFRVHISSDFSQWHVERVQ